MDPDRGTILATTKLPADVVCIRYHYDAVWVRFQEFVNFIFITYSSSLNIIFWFATGRTWQRVAGSVSPQLLLVVMGHHVSPVCALGRDRHASDVAASG